MADKLLEQLADDIVSGLKGFFAHRINNGEDPTTCMQMFLNFLESNKDKNPQLFREIASKIDASFFTPLKKVNQIASLDDFIAAYHNLEDKLIEINPHMPYKTDYERQHASIENQKGLIKERLRKEKEEKKRFVDNEYRRASSERVRQYKKTRGKSLRIGFIICFILFVVLLLVDILVHPQSSEDAREVCAGVGGIIGFFVVGGVLAGLIPEKWEYGGCLGFWGGGAAAAAGFWWVFSHATPYLIFPWLILILGTILAILYGSRVDAMRSTPEEGAAYDTSLDNIEKHFSAKEKDEIAKSMVRILATGGATLDLDKGTTIDEATSDLAIEEDLAVGAMTLRGHAKTVSSVSFSPDWKKLASGSWDKRIIIWDSATGRKENILKRHTGRVFSVCFSPDGKKLASASADKRIIIWDVATGRAEKTLRGHTDNVYSACFSPDGKKLASGSTDMRIIIWDMATSTAAKTLREHTSFVNSVCFSPDGKKLASGSADNTIIIWDVATGRAEKTLRGHTDNVYSACFSPDGNKLASGSEDNTIIIWDVATGRAEETLREHTDHVLSVCFSPDGKKLASGSTDMRIIIWDSATGRTENILKRHTGRVFSVCFSSDGKKLASGSEDKTIKLSKVVR